MSRQDAFILRDQVTEGMAQALWRYGDEVDAGQHTVAIEQALGNGVLAVTIYSKDPDVYAQVATGWLTLHLADQDGEGP